MRPAAAAAEAVFLPFCLLSSSSSRMGAPFPCFVRPQIIHVNQATSITIHNVVKRRKKNQAAIKTRQRCFRRKSFKIHALTGVI
jgi:hypothetical protein